MGFEVIKKPAQDVLVGFNSAEIPIALVTKKPAHMTRIMTVVDMQWAGAWSPATYRAAVTLRGKHHLIVFDGDAVDSLELGVALLALDTGALGGVSFELCKSALLILLCFARMRFDPLLSVGELPLTVVAVLGF